MPQIIVCSICSRKKRADVDLLPAVERYAGSHIQKVQVIAALAGKPFFILSGLHGLLAAEEEIENYDFQLSRREDSIQNLSVKIQRQLQFFGIKEIHFYTKNKPAWLVYRDALIRATNAAGVKLHLYYISDES